jgi:hypothetical protein
MLTPPSVHPYFPWKENTKMEKTEIISQTTNTQPVENKREQI